jgi:hypothetical protein
MNQLDSSFDASGVVSPDAVLRGCQAGSGPDAHHQASLTCRCGYESQILLMLAFPITLPLFHAAMAAARPTRRLVRRSIAYLVMTFAYSTGGGTTYQLSVMRTVWRPSVLAGDWLFNIVASLILDVDSWRGSYDSVFGGSFHLCGCRLLGRRHHCHEAGGRAERAQRCRAAPEERLDTSGVERSL